MILDEVLLRDCILRRVVVNQETGCWEWSGARTAAGYGELRHQGTTALAHRVAYELCVGPIPGDLEIDHLCRVRHCANPEHLEPVTHAENMRRSRRSHCRRGHELTPENTYVRHSGPRAGIRECRTCRLASNRRWVERRA